MDSTENQSHSAPAQDKNSTATKTQTTSRKRCKKKKHSKKKSDNIPTSHKQENTNVSDNVLQDINQEKLKHYLIYSNINYMDCPKKAASLFNIKNNDPKAYTVNNSVFVDRETKMHPDEEYKDYTVYKVIKDDINEDEYDSSEDGISEDLEIEDESIPTGHIINSNVFLTHEQWNTVLPIDNSTYACIVCGMQYNIMDLAGHMNSNAHIMNLDAHQPRKKFDLSITRKINNNYHCAVCNEVFPVDQYSEHENSKIHEGNLLFSINKVSDLYLENISLREKKFSQHLEINNIQAPNNAPRHNQLNNTLLYRNISLNSNIQPDGNIQPYGNIESVRHSEPVGNTEPARNIQPNPNIQPKTDTFDNSSENSFKFGSSTYKDIKIYEEEMEDCIEECILPLEGISYASMASKPRVEVPKILKIDLGTKEVRVKFESWHMITLTDASRYYCMLCKGHFIRRLRVQHCQEATHVSHLSRCVVVGAFEDYLIRDVNDNLYHCGHCNNLQCKDAIDIHIELYHPRKNKPLKPIDMNVPTNQTNVSTNHTNFSTNHSVSTNHTNVSTNHTNVSTNHANVSTNHANVSVDQSVSTNQSSVSDVMNIENIRTQLDIFGDYHFSPFGTDIKISNLACHTLMKADKKYYCALCNVYCGGDLLDHVFMSAHMQLMTMTPFIRPFKNNLTRAVKDSLHCAICNILIAVDKIFDHNVNPSHTMALATALGMKKNRRPVHEKKYQYEGPSNPSMDLPNIMSMLPSIHKFEVHTPEGETFVLSNASSSNATPLLSPSDPQIHKAKVPKTNPDGAKFVKLPQTTVIDSVNKTPKKLHQGHISESGHGTIEVNITGPVVKAADSNVNVALVRSLKDVENELLAQYKHFDEFKAKTEAAIAEIHKSETLRTKPTKEFKKKKSDKIVASSKGKDFPDSDEEELQPVFQLDETVFLKLKSMYFKITNTAYNTLVHVGNGMRHCFVCSITLDYGVLQRHVDSREHNDNMAKNKILSNNLFSGQLFRQMYIMYHCAICNVLMSRAEVKPHLDWPTHIEKYDDCCQKLNKKLRDLLKSGVKERTVETQKEYLYLNVPEPTVNVITYVKSSTVEVDHIYVENKLVRKCRMVILGSNVMKVSFESWHGIYATRNAIKCIICQMELNEDGLAEHLRSKYHNVALGIHFEKQFYPALIRKINVNTINCVICNLELPSDDSLVYEHINGRKHDKNYNNIIKTSNTDSYTDCYEDPLTL